MRKSTELIVCAGGVKVLSCQIWPLLPNLQISLRRDLPRRFRRLSAHDGLLMEDKLFHANDCGYRSKRMDDLRLSCGLVVSALVNNGTRMEKWLMSTLEQEAVVTDGCTPGRRGTSVST